MILLLFIIFDFRVLSLPELSRYTREIQVFITKQFQRIKYIRTTQPAFVSKCILHLFVDCSFLYFCFLFILHVYHFLMLPLMYQGGISIKYYVYLWSFFKGKVIFQWNGKINNTDKIMLYSTWLVINYQILEKIYYKLSILLSLFCLGNISFINNN